ncbi:hypothetical protein Taro_046567 [Colocasia esculenta]|uniref:Uncharacterized protein n=1 Tax=Colocasia esculenta TaxID=4460 RepID=A0A843X4B2_COLES|nr:hypothetical protein [Colocasia esculenta]
MTQFGFSFDVFLPSSPAQFLSSLSTGMEQQDERAFRCFCGRVIICLLLNNCNHLWPWDLQKMDSAASSIQGICLSAQNTLFKLFSLDPPRFDG